MKFAVTHKDRILYTFDEENLDKEWLEIQPLQRAGYQIEALHGDRLHPVSRHDGSYYIRWVPLKPKVQEPGLRDIHILLAFFWPEN